MAKGRDGDGGAEEQRSAIGEGSTMGKQPLQLASKKQHGNEIMGAMGGKEQPMSIAAVREN